MKTINSFRSKLLALTLAIVASVSSFAYEFEYVNDFHIDGFAYKILPSNTMYPYGSVALVEIADCNKDVVIPEFVSYGNTEYRIITFGIGSVVFTNEASSVVESITIPKTIDIINKNVLAGCPNLKTVVVDSENPYYDSRENCNAIITTSQNPYFTPNTLIAGCKMTIIPNSVTEIGDNAFYNCESLDIITIPNSVTKIGNSAFNACSSLSSIILSENLTAIGDWAFDDCNNLKEVICYALQPPTISKYTFPGFAPWVYVPTESIERYKAASEWKKLLICDISWFEACNEYKHVKLSVISYGNKLIYSLVTDDGSEIPDVDSVWILNTDKEPLQKFYGQSRDTIDLLFLELGTYILEVYLNECVKRKIFFVHPKMKYIWCDTWNVLELKYRYSSYTTKEDFETWRYYLAQDTIINNYTYTAVTRQTTKVPEGVYPFTIPEPKYVAAVRFTDDRKVYIYYDNTEYLLYDFNVQPGDELTVFAGINHYHSHHTNTIRVDEVFGTEISLSVFPDFYGDVRPTCFGVTKWVEGVGDLCGFITGADCGLSEYQTALLCAYKDGNTEYTTEYEEYAEYGCEYNSGENKEYILTLPGLQRTHTIEMYDHAPNDGKRSGGYPLPFASIKDTVINGKTYLQFGDYVNGSDYSLFFLREENNKVLIYSSILQNDLVLYDYTLELGDSLPAITSDHDYFSDDHFTKLDKAENIFTYVVTDVSTITLLDGMERKKWTLQNQYLGIMEYVEGIGCFGEKNSHSGDFFRLIYDHPYKTEYVGDHLVCVSKNGQLLYSMPQEEMNSFTLTCECLSQEDTIAPKDLFPTLWGLQRTSCDEWFDGCEENKSYLFAPKEITEINGKQYLKCGGVFLREEDSKVLIYSFPYEKDLVLYDYTLEVGDTLQNLGIDIYSFPELEYAAVVDYIAYEDYDVETDEFIIKKEPLGSKRVTEVSTTTLLDGKEYKRWLFGNDWENGNYYVEGIGNVGGSFGGDYINIANPYALPTCYMGEHLVCVSKNNKLLYQMDPVKMDELGAECLCDYNRGPRKDNAKDGQIGGRPTPTQWNQLEVVLRQMDNNHTILQAETFSYTLEDISQQVNNKTYFQLARQSTKDTATTKSVVGALHFGKDEDNRVYFLRDGVEYVLYDFTAEIGDTVEIFAGINNYPQETTYTHVVVDKDTTEDGACRMFLEVVFPDETNATAENAEKVWLAGLGSVDGIVHNAAKRTSNAHAAPSRSASSSETESSVMLCAWREDSCLYTTNHPDYDTFGCVYNQDPTAVEDISTSQSSYQKLLRDGQLFIIHDGKTYNVLGVPME